MTVQSRTIKLPAAWSTALINGDYSGLDKDEAERCRKVEAMYAKLGWTFSDCESEAHFTWSYDTYDPGAGVRGGEILRYTIVREEG